MAVFQKGVNSRVKLRARQVLAFDSYLLSLSLSRVQVLLLFGNCNVCLYELFLAPAPLAQNVPFRRRRVFVPCWVQLMVSTALILLSERLGPWMTICSAIILCRELTVSTTTTTSSLTRY